jgi:hypothetical protein
VLEPQVKETMVRMLAQHPFTEQLVVVQIRLVHKMVQVGVVLVLTLQFLALT